ncbi:MAG: response regulator, partial [Anaerolineae bacterium]|nr:response regulator [Anaerolineae bacterium]
VEGLTQAEVNPPDLVVVDVMMPRMTGYEFCRQARTKPALEEVPIIMFSARFQPVDRQTALDAGATDYLSKTTSPNELLHRISGMLPATVTTTTQTTLGLFSLRGGTGLTSLAVNVAVNLATTKKQPTALVDLARLGGHTALMMGLRPTSSVSQVLNGTKNDLTPDALKPHLIGHSSGVQLLASGYGYDHQLQYNDKRLGQLVTTLKSTFAYTIFDVPHILEPSLVPTLQLFDKIGMVISPDTPSLQSTAMALQVLTRLGIPNDKIVLIVNNIISTNAIPPETIQKVVKLPILTTIPYEPEMIKAVNSGSPLITTSPNSPGAVAIAKLTTALVD